MFHNNQQNHVKKANLCEPSLLGWRKEVFAVFRKIKRHKEPYKITVEGLSLTVLPGVYSPKYFTDSLWFAKTLTGIVGRSSLLEMGTGTGIIALFASLNGARVTATDINPLAYENAGINAKKHGQRIDLRVGNLYEPVKGEKFDFIFWNHPFNEWGRPVKDVLLKAGFDAKYEALEGYIAGAKEHLSKKGRLLLGTGSFANLKRIEEIAGEYGYSLLLLAKEEHPLQTGGGFLNEYLIYELKTAGQV